MPSMHEEPADVVALTARELAIQTQAAHDAKMKRKAENAKGLLL